MGLGAVDWNGENIVVVETETACSMVEGMGSTVVEENGTVTAAEEDWGRVM